MVQKQNVHSNYEHLVKQQYLAHQGNDVEFNELIDDFFLIKNDLVKILPSFFEVIEVKDILKSFKKLHEHNNKTSQVDHGTPVFHRFYGHWNGVWSQFNSDQSYDHDWYPPNTQKDLVIQKVIIGQWDNKQQKRLNEIPAINTYNVNTGLILGGVDFNQQTKKTMAPHLGFYVNDNTLVWFAKFTRKKVAYYSLYYERVKGTKHKTYKIKGLGLYWDKKKIIQPHKKTGFYKQI